MKRFLTAFLSVIMLFSMCCTGFAECLSNGKSLAAPSEWALADIEKAEAIEITESGKVYRYRMPVTRQEFCEMVYNYYEKYADDIQIVNAGNPFLDTENENVIVLYALEIIRGKNETEFVPNDLLTREEAAAVMAIGMAGSALPPEPIEVKFNKPFTFVVRDNINGEILFIGEYAFAE